MDWLRSILGPQPELRLIVLLLAAIAVLLLLNLDQGKRILRNMPDPCGESNRPCDVRVSTSYY